MVPINLKVLAKFGLCSNCSLSRARKIFATARILGFCSVSVLASSRGVVYARKDVLRSPYSIKSFTCHLYFLNLSVAA